MASALPLQNILSCPAHVLPDIVQTPIDVSQKPYKAPTRILIIGAGVFGLSTALSLSQRPEFAQTTITILDRSPETGVFPSRDASSIDSSRIIRPDYADPSYAKLASEAQARWRETEIGRDGRYTESGFILAADAGPLMREDGSPTGIAYAKKSWVNAMALAQAEGRPLSSVRLMAGAKRLARVTGVGEFADWGYLNDASGWADAEASMGWFYEQVIETGRVTFVNGTVESLETNEAERKVTGARLKDGSTISADLVITAAGAWTPTLIDLSSQAIATGQVLGYIDLTEEEQKKLEDIPVILNLTTGFFVIPPRNRVLKVARHAFGYLNPKTPSQAPLGIPGSEKSTVKPISQPFTHIDDPSLSIPEEGERSLREGLRRLIPWPELQERPFSRTRLCWYTDTATGDWIIDYHPYWQGLFVATGGSGHAFKFLPIIGDKVVDCIMGHCPIEFQQKWKWKAVDDIEKAIVTQDGSRGGEPGLILEDEFKRVSKDK
ncbi:putative fructosyl amino acid protein [Annulohypoxylon maeteangense]|uniref:putative fructosyl amino acid protein n=1 Tax=Annulohypoxylon maeteangense TaxID=1927788 RepID=UPI002008A6BC|nr:putative fructosyl amino acid protein [Annulohypoxylon maeteangense]KAI0888231.1 putative fructosyl amino acid protein [Annulohypoxylon maeteangense]